MAKTVQEWFRLESCDGAPSVIEEGSGFSAVAIVFPVLFWVLGVLPAAQIAAILFSDLPLYAALIFSGVMLVGTAIFVALYVWLGRRAFIRHLKEAYSINLR